MTSEAEPNAGLLALTAAARKSEEMTEPNMAKKRLSLNTVCLFISRSLILEAHNFCRTLLSNPLLLQPCQKMSNLCEGRPRQLQLLLQAMRNNIRAAILSSRIPPLLNRLKAESNCPSKHQQITPRLLLLFIGNHQQGADRLGSTRIRLHLTRTLPEALEVHRIRPTPPMPES